MKPVIPHSLRARLLWFLLVAIIATTGVQAFVAYRTALSETDEIFDYQMQQMASSLRAGFPVAPDVVQLASTDDTDNFEFVIQIWSVDGLRVFQSAAKAELPQRALLGFSKAEARGVSYRIFSVAAGSRVIQVAQDMAARQKMAGKLAVRTIAPMVLMVPLLMLVIWWIVSTSLAPVARVRQQVASRQADELSEVSEDGLPDEIRPLVHELNLLFYRVRLAFDAQKNFVADAAHELRSPLAALKLQVQGLRRATDNSAREVAIVRLDAGIDRATRLVEQLLILARQQAKITGIETSEPVDFSTMVRLIVADLWGSANDRHIDFGIVFAEDSWITGHKDALRILVRNLLDNAIKYTPQGGIVNISVRVSNSETQLTVEDSGPSIPEPDRARVFDRFYRLDGAKNNGSGLGLAIVKTIADLHKAKVWVDQSDSLGGLKIAVIFPAPAKPLDS